MVQSVAAGAALMSATASAFAAVTARRTARAAEETARTSLDSQRDTRRALALALRPEIMLRHSDHQGFTLVNLTEPRAAMLDLVAEIHDLDGSVRTAKLARLDPFVSRDPSRGAYEALPADQGVWSLAGGPFDSIVLDLWDERRVGHWHVAITYAPLMEGLYDLDWRLLPLEGES